MAYDPEAKRHNVDYQGNKHEQPSKQADHLEEFKWKKGQSGNPSGRKKGSVSLVESLKKHLARHPEDVERIIAMLVKQGMIGNMTATKEMLERIDGRVVETHKLEGDIPIKVVFVPAQEAIDKEATNEVL